MLDANANANASAELDARLTYGLSGLALTAGVAQLLLFHHQATFFLATAVLALLGAVDLVRLVLHPRFVTMPRVLALALSLGYGIGTLNTLASGYSDDRALQSLTYAPRSSIAICMGLILLLYPILQISSHLFSKKPFEGITPSENDEKAALIYCGGVALSLLVMLATGKMGLQAGIGLEGGGASVMGSLVFNSIGPAAALSTYMAARTGGRYKKLFATQTLLLILGQSTQGRRFLIFSVLTCVMAFTLASGHGIFKKPKTWVAILAVVFASAFLAKFFYAARQAKFEPGMQDADVPSLMAAGFRNMLNSTENQEADYANNQQTRTFVIGYLSELYDATRAHETLHGDVAIFSAALVVPAALWPGKWKYAAYGADEALAHPALGLPIWDAANSIVTAGITDFGIPGMLIYPATLAILIQSLVLACKRRASTVASLFISFGILATLVNLETMLGGMLGTIRNTLIAGMALQIICLLVSRLTYPKTLIHKQGVSGS